MRIDASVLLLGAVMLGGCASEQRELPFRPVANVSELMTTMIDPAADVVWNSVGTIITPEGEEHWEPETEEEWAAVLNGAVTLTESANLLMLGERAQDQDTWMRLSQGMADAGLLAWEAAESKDAEGMFSIGADVYNSCVQCHNLYWVNE